MIRLVIVSRQTGNSIESANFSARHLSNSYSRNYELVWNLFCIKKRRELHEVN